MFELPHLQRQAVLQHTRFKKGFFYKIHCEVVE